MKVFTAVYLLFITIAPAKGKSQAAFSTTQTHSNRPRISLELGSVAVWLGMSESEALLQFQSVGYQLLAASADGSQLIRNKDQIYSIRFRNGKLAYADREWYSSETDEISAVLGALTAMASYGADVCSISHQPLSKPDESADRIFIDCGERSVLLMKGHFGGSEKNTFVTVAERIGQAQ